MLVDLLTSFIDVICAAITVKKIHQTSFVVVVVLNIACVCSCLVDSRLSTSLTAVFNSLLYNILSSIMRVASGRQMTLSILSLLNILLCKHHKSHLLLRPSLFICLNELIYETACNCLLGMINRIVVSFTYSRSFPVLHYRELFQQPPFQYHRSRFNLPNSLCFY